MKDIEGVERVLEVLTPEWPRIEREFERQNERYLALASTDPDPIGRVLKIHLVIERFVEDFLASFYGIEDVGSLRLSFHQKASLLPSRHSSAAFVRPGIIQLNGLRNRYGHSLGHKAEPHEISAIYEVLQVARRETTFPDCVTAIEAFGPVACAFLSVPPANLADIFVKAFSQLQSFDPGNLEEDVANTAAVPTADIPAPKG